MFVLPQKMLSISVGIQLEPQPLPKPVNITSMQIVQNLSWVMAKCFTNSYNGDTPA